MTLDAALLDLDVAVRRTLLHRPRRQQEAVRRAVQDVVAAARAEAAGARLDAREQLQAALERAAAELGWTEVTAIVNKAGRLLGGTARRAG